MSVMWLLDPELAGKVALLKLALLPLLLAGYFLWLTFRSRVADPTAPA